MPKDKTGKQITWGEFITRWGTGIKQVATNPTPLERLSIELRATFINLIGITTCLTALIIFRDKFFVSWFAYGLILIFVATLITTALKFFGLREQKKFLKSLEETSIEDLYSQSIKDESDTSNEIHLEPRSKIGEEDKLEDMSIDTDTHSDDIKEESEGGEEWELKKQ